jgi:hypothetical protein
MKNQQGATGIILDASYRCFLLVYSRENFLQAYQIMLSPTVIHGIFVEISQAEYECETVAGFTAKNTEDPLIVIINNT